MRLPPRRRRAVICSGICYLHQNDIGISCLAARQPTDHWAQAWTSRYYTGVTFSTIGNRRPRSCSLAGSWLQLSPTHSTHSPRDGRPSVHGRARLTISVGFHYCCGSGGVCEWGTASGVDCPGQTTETNAALHAVDSNSNRPTGSNSR